MNVKTIGIDLAKEIFRDHQIAVQVDIIGKFPVKGSAPNAHYVQLPISLGKTGPLPKNDRLSRILPRFLPLPDPFPC